MPQIQDLPNELLIEVAQLVCSGDARIVDNALDIPAHRFGHVCQNWRNVALSTKSLWTSISARFISKTSLMADNALKAIELLLRCSGDSALNLHFDLWVEVAINNQGLILFMVESCRWTSLHLRIPTIRELNCLQAVVGHLPRLQRLELVVMQPQGLLQSPKTFSLAPRLSTIDLQSAMTCLLDLPWDQLETMTVGPTNMQDLVTLLDVCTRLSTLKLRHLSLGSMIKGTVYWSTLCHLTFQIDFLDQWWSALEFFTRVTLPSLKSLCLFSLRDHLATIRDFDEIFNEFIRRSDCRLDTLRIDNLPLADVVLVRLLPSIPHLKHLFVHDAVHKDMVTEQFLTRLKQDATLLPRLQHLDLVCRSGLDTITAEVVTSRSTGDFPLRSLRLNEIEKQMYSGTVISAITCPICSQVQRFDGDFRLSDFEIS